MLAQPEMVVVSVPSETIS